SRSAGLVRSRQTPHHESSNPSRSLPGIFSLLVPKCYRLIDGRRPACGDIGRDECYCDEEQSRSHKSRRISWSDSIKETRDYLDQYQRSSNSDRHSSQVQEHALTDYQGKYPACRSAERNPNAQLLSTPQYGIRNQ